MNGSSLLLLAQFADANQLAAEKLGPVLYALLFFGVILTGIAVVFIALGFNIYYLVRWTRRQKSDGSIAGQPKEADFPVHVLPPRQIGQ